ncbi:ornithine cyclodeaminase family protein [Streptomyces sp. URMC 129]|uniref:ornithine cyclodeaminase family protein n=1 Tax=Streptomyces sp. URMC 129 TaxID=3423407 RepID=UPI003F1D669F
MIVLNGADVRELLRMPEAIALMREVLATFSTGGVTQPLRTVLRPAGHDTVLGSMPAHLGTGRHTGFGVKTVLVKPGNAALGRDTHMGLVIVHDEATGLPAAVMDAGAVTAVRTAAVSAVATDVLAHPAAGDLALLGSGTQARTHLEALGHVRRLRRVRVWSRSAPSAERFARWADRRLGVTVEPAATVAAAVADADLVCTLTAAATPVLEGHHLGDGAHVNAVGACFPHTRELATDVVERAAVFVDSRESALSEAGDLLVPIREGRFGPDRIRAELGEVLAGKAPGRAAPEERTVFKSLGIAAEDVMAGLHIAERARTGTTGIRIPWPGDEDHP